MFSLSSQANYGLTFLKILAESKTAQPVALKKIAKDYNLPSKFLSSVATKLVKAGLIYSKEGKNGGYLLKANPKNITLAEIFSILENKKSNLSCTGTCNYSCDFCATRDVVMPAEEKLNQILSEKTLADIVIIN